MNTTAQLRTTFLALGAAVALAACGDKDVTNVVAPVATSLSITASSNGQTGTAGTALASPLSVMVLDQNGVALSGATVTWETIGGRGTLSAASSTSDANGLATVTLTLGNTAGTDSVRALLANGTSVYLTATNTAAAFTTLSLVSGDVQSVTAGSATQALVVRAVDQYGNAVAGVPVTWATTGGGTMSAESGTTDASGLAQITLTRSSTAGAYTVTASSGTATPITFNGSGT